MEGSSTSQNMEGSMSSWPVSVGFLRQWVDGGTCKDLVENAAFNMHHITIIHKVLDLPVASSCPKSL